MLRIHLREHPLSLPLSPPVVPGEVREGDARLDDLRVVRIDPLRPVDHALGLLELAAPREQEGVLGEEARQVGLEAQRSEEQLLRLAELTLLGGRLRAEREEHDRLAVELQALPYGGAGLAPPFELCERPGSELPEEGLGELPRSDPVERRERTLRLPDVEVVVGEAELLRHVLHQAVPSTAKMIASCTMKPTITAIRPGIQRLSYSSSSGANVE